MMCLKNSLSKLLSANLFFQGIFLYLHQRQRVELPQAVNVRLQELKVDHVWEGLSELWQVGDEVVERDKVELHGRGFVGSVSGTEHERKSDNLTEYSKTKKKPSRNVSRSNGNNSSKANNNNNPGSSKSNSINGNNYNSKNHIDTSSSSNNNSNNSSNKQRKQQQTANKNIQITCSTAYPGTLATVARTR